MDDWDEGSSESEDDNALRLWEEGEASGLRYLMDWIQSIPPRSPLKDEQYLPAPAPSETGPETSEMVHPPPAALVLFPRTTEADVPRPVSPPYHERADWNLQRPRRSDSPRARLRAFMGRPQAPLAMNPPTRPGTARTSESHSLARSDAEGPAAEEMADMSRGARRKRLRSPRNRPLAPLAMNPPTRPGTATSSVSHLSSTWTWSSIRPDQDVPTMAKLSGLNEQSVARFKSMGSQGSPPTRLRTVASSEMPAQELPSHHRPVVYGKGKYADVEVTPQPSNDPDDPLNWPTWKKEVNFGALLLMAALTGVLKTIFVSVNALVAVQYRVSYTAVAALTGVPLILSALSGLLGLATSRCCGKRPVYLAGLLLIFVGTVWNTRAARSYGQCMAARVFQGLGWGVFDGLVVASIGDTYFEHERGLRLAVYSVVAVATTWGPPLVGGAVSQTAAGFTQQFTVLSIFFVLAVPAVALGMPETSFDRTSLSSAQKPAPGPGYTETVTVLTYLASMKPRLRRSDGRGAARFSQTLLAVVAPTTLLTSVVATLPFVALWGLTSSLALFSTATPKDLGTLLTGPWLFATATVAGFALYPSWRARFAPPMHVAAMAGGTVLVFIGLLATGLGMHASAVNLPSLSALLGLLAAGAYVLDAATRPLIHATVQSTCSNSATTLRATANMDAAAVFWRALVAGLAALAVPASVASKGGLKAWCVGAAVSQIIVAVLVGAVWWFWDDRVRGADGRVMKLVPWSTKKQRSTASFFDPE